MFKRITTVAAVAATLAVTAYAGQKDIVDTAVSAGQFKTLVSLVQQADLVSTLKGEGPFTVLAPSDAAFAKLPKDLVQKVTSDPELLKKVLTYHVIPGKVMSKNLKNGASVKTVQGEAVKVKLSGKKAMFNGAQVAKADISASNGVIHVIDTVILPPSLAASAK
jgi:uncharacterized surface protein with fasciclin (FAS1) repeats